MSHRIACYTLFDITNTGILNRARPGTDVTDTNDWYRKRNTQCNFDTILQIVSLRAQPDVVNTPKFLESVLIDSYNFGEKYKNTTCNIWTFDFEVHHSSVFEDGKMDLGALYKDCEFVPMIITETCSVKNDNALLCDDLNRNIYFVKY